MILSTLSVLLLFANGVVADPVADPKPKPKPSGCGGRGNDDGIYVDTSPYCSLETIDKTCGPNHYCAFTFDVGLECVEYSGVCGFYTGCSATSSCGAGAVCMFTTWGSYCGEICTSGCFVASVADSTVPFTDRFSSSKQVLWAESRAILESEGIVAATDTTKSASILSSTTIAASAGSVSLVVLAAIFMVFRRQRQSSVPTFSSLGQYDSMHNAVHLKTPVVVLEETPYSNSQSDHGL